MIKGYSQDLYWVAHSTTKKDYIISNVASIYKLNEALNIIQENNSSLNKREEAQQQLDSIEVTLLHEFGHIKNNDLKLRLYLKI